MTNLQKVGGRVEVAKKRYFKDNTWTKLDSFCEWCDRECEVAYRECEVAYYEVYFDESVFKIKDFSDVVKIICSLNNKFTKTDVYNELSSYLNDHTRCFFCWYDDFEDKHCIDIVSIYK